MSDLLKNFFIFLVFATILSFFSSIDLKGQVKMPLWEIGVSSLTGAGQQAPFWLISNRQGKYLPEKYAASMDLSLFSEKDTVKIFDYNYGLEFYGRMYGSGDLWLHRAFGELRFYDFVQLRVGIWEELAGNYEPSLSTGSVIWSGNARPMPKIEVGTAGYVPVPFTGGYAEISGVISHGWFEKGRYVSDVWLHHKNLYVRVGGAFPVNIHYGFDHYSQWGGNSPAYDEPFPSDFKSFWKVLFIRKGDPDEPGTPEEWVINRFGNHIGSRSYGIDLNLRSFSVGIYHQDLFEDNSGYSRKNFPDGLWGVKLRFKKENRPVQAILYEYLQTTHQSGPYHHIDGDTLGGNDNYFNHGHYRSGWTYHKYTIGTPMITSTVLNEPPSFRIRNNRVIAHHLGFEGSVTRNIRYRSFFTFSRNFGTYNTPFEERRDQFSWMMGVTGPLNFFDLEAGVTMAADTGSMYGNNFGVLFTLKKSGSFSGLGRSGK